MAAYRFLSLLSLVTFVFGGLTFIVLAYSYWRQRGRRQTVLPVFTGVCAVSFLLNLALRVGLEGPSATVSDVVLDLAAGLVPALLLQLMIGGGRRQVLTVFYGVAVVAAVARAVDDAEWVALPWSSRLPALVLGLSGAAGLLWLAQERRRTAFRILLWLTVACAAVNVWEPATFASLLPDYLILILFAAILYYDERLVFFDLLIKRGAFFLLGLVGLTASFSLVSRVVEPWVAALILSPLWLIGPWIYGRIGALVDHWWLRRPYAAADAERLFGARVQASATENELCAAASHCLAEIFQAPASVRFDGGLPPQADGPFATLGYKGERSGWIHLAPRPNRVPYLSDDFRLLQSLARTLSVVLDNVRFRQRQEELRMLASRAELKALRAQINPHFLFNALNAIAGLITVNPQLADETVEQLANVFRYALRKSEKEWVRLDEEVEFAVAYLRVEQARFGSRLRLEVAVDPAAAAVPVPAMCIQPLVENAVKHGISMVEGPGMVGLRAALDGAVLHVEVYDNGPGFPAGFSLNAEGGHALRNIVDRMNGYYGAAAQISWDERRDGACVSLRVPVSGRP